MGFLRYRRRRVGELDHHVSELQGRSTVRAFAFAVLGAIPRDDGWLSLEASFGTSDTWYCSRRCHEQRFGLGDLR